MENKTLISGLIAGVGGLIITTIVIILIINTIDDANLLQTSNTVVTVNNESGAFINASGYTLAKFTDKGRSYTIVSVWNNTGPVIAAGNYTLNANTGKVTNATAMNVLIANITYTYIPASSYEQTTTGMTGNLTSGIDNVSGKIPTVLLIGAIILLLGVIALLVRQSQMMGLGSFGGGNSSREGSL